MRRTRYGSLAIYLAATAALAASPAVARDYWNGSGFPLDHNFHSPYDNIFGRGGSSGGGGGRYAPGGPQIIHVPQDYDDNNPRSGQDVEGPQRARDAARAKAKHDKTIRDERTCAPVVLYTDEGRVVQPALGCRR